MALWGPIKVDTRTIGGWSATRCDSQGDSEVVTYDWEIVLDGQPPRRGTLDHRVSDGPTALMSKVLKAGQQGCVSPRVDQLEAALNVALSHLDGRANSGEPDRRLELSGCQSLLGLTDPILPRPAPRGRVLPAFDADWNSRTDGNRLWDLVDVPETDLPSPGDPVVLAILEGHRQIGEAMLATVHEVRKPEANPSAGWVVTFDWLDEHICH